MPHKFQKLNYSTVYQEAPLTQTSLVANAAFVTVAEFNVTALAFMTVSIAVATAPLTGVEIWVRGDSNAAWIQLTLAQILGYGCSDSSTDVTQTPAGVSMFLQFDCTGWSDIRINAKSSGNADLNITAGGK